MRVAVAIFNSEHKVLVIDRRDADASQPYWVLPEVSRLRAPEEEIQRPEASIPG